jgi:hypothetical protein
MNSRRRALGVSYVRVPAGLLLWGLTVGSGCAGQAQQVPQPAPRQTEGASPLAEEFDPRSVREDLLLIEPAFAPPAAESSVSEGGSSVEKRPGGGSAATESRGAYRVQVVALSSETAARVLAGSLQRQLGVEVTVFAHNGLHAVRAGRLAGPDAAQALRARIAEMKSDFSDAFVVHDPAAGQVESPIEKRHPPGEEPEQDLPGPEDPGLLHEPGWRVLIYESLDLADAEAFRRKAVERLGRDDVEINFHEPLFKVEVGQFRAGEEASAQELVALVKRRGFPSALKVRREVTVPKEDQ